MCGGSPDLRPDPVLVELCGDAPGAGGRRAGVPQLDGLPNKGFVPLVDFAAALVLLIWPAVVVG
jgi:hypothetical protein